jgi:Raf kinase inhibitor-like YbhB/YbcL family protein
MCRLAGAATRHTFPGAPSAQTAGPGARPSRSGRRPWPDPPPPPAARARVTSPWATSARSRPCRGRGRHAALVLFVDDPDGGDWIHWSVLDLPAADGELPRGVDPAADPPQQGRNDFGRIGYGGPCPPSGTHHYRFTLHALAAPLALPRHPDGGAVRAALRGATILSRAMIVGTFRA